MNKSSEVTSIVGEVTYRAIESVPENKYTYNSRGCKERGLIHIREIAEVMSVVLVLRDLADLVTN